MTATATQRERQLLGQMAEEYGDLGYQVTMDPNPEELPDFLRDFRPDAIARKNGDNVVIELKRNDFVKPRYELRKLAIELAKHPGWHLRVVIVGVPPHERQAELPALSIKDVQHQRSSIEALYGTGQQAAALLLLWSLFEALAHLRMQERDVERRRPQSPVALAKDLVSLGTIEQTDYERLLDVIALRNKIAHGFPNLDIDQNVYKTLRDLVDKVLGSNDDAEAEN